VVPRLVRAIEALDYPAAKLQVMFVLEADDRETAAALAAASLPGFVEVIFAPPGEPRTKPRALNVALPLARGEFVTVYDAEDVPDPGQLRLAVSYFRRSGPDVACLQARLVIDNVADCWLTRMFAIEYAALFDVTNPALARFDLPVPLGGTSNHFRRSVLQALGGWDAWNVTEDADLGIRLAAAGYRVVDLPSSTLEEAPRQLGAWLQQRTRWMKGFLQVSVTHSRRPRATLRELGTARALGALAVSFGTVASALGFPIFMVLAGRAAITGELFQADTPLGIASASIGLTLFAAGLLALTLPPLAALRRRDWMRLAPLVALMPVYYCLVSLAAWRGLGEFVLKPQRWNKTEHGLAKTSRAGLV
jgi:cellulose synthase/poly-beta-1,6-N-acetylglucosamine synthase-like glycosyltransferase